MWLFWPYRHRSRINVLVSINSPTKNLSDIIIDSGSDITLILEKTLGGLSEIPKVKKGQKINLVQVTGKASISGYMELDYISTPRKDRSKLKSKPM